MNTILSKAADAHILINEILDFMLEQTGGDSGRDFTPKEKETWDALIKARQNLMDAEKTDVARFGMGL
jgi:hypothetical protein